MKLSFAQQLARGAVARPVHGQAMVEFAFVILLLVGAVLAIVEGARWMVTYFALANAAAEGARAGAFVPSAAWSASSIDARIDAAARSVLPPWITLADDEISVCRLATSVDNTCSTGDVAPSPAIISGSFVEITITHTFRWFPFATGYLGQPNDLIRAVHRQRID